ncbi:precorrin-6A synthase (deacetylating) [Novosphingobium sp. 11B]|uniref:Precorrin-6A synthase [deacetylating] n=1 Tax=Novosphingobium resinovorum TaxID=158500 RepID=A0A031J826_9SPHN|nr:precorrin-6A synthase (deacetylating) [Novosphingobium resinovorum]AOR78783.1 precorrin-6A synthase (deacetylating) [Novosphingobium resinovorum]EZP70319.1 Precorrin-6A synthase (Deacetylating) [Novosphingobium resinovorum]
MIRLDLIGIGTGNPEHLTVQAIRTMNGADLILLPRKGSEKSGLLDVRRTICDAVLTQPVRVVEFDLPTRDAGGEYINAVQSWHNAIAAAWAKQMALHLPEGGRLALLVWGDPSLYDSTLRIAGRLIGGGMAIDIRVVPGISSLHALTAAHAIPLNQLAEAVTITTGRLLRAHGWPGDATSIVVMLDEGGAFQTLDGSEFEIWWGACLGMEHEALISGRLAQIGDDIMQRRSALRQEHGWIMDIYLLRKIA